MGIMKGLDKVKDWTTKLNMVGAKLAGMGMNGEKTKLNPKRGESVEETIYPLSPVKSPKKLKRLPSHLKKTKYRGLI